jgi:hypothetical protein
MMMTVVATGMWGEAEHRNGASDGLVGLAQLGVTMQEATNAFIRLGVSMGRLVGAEVSGDVPTAPTLASPVTDEDRSRAPQSPALRVIILRN